MKQIKIIYIGLMLVLWTSLTAQKGDLYLFANSKRNLDNELLGNFQNEVGQSKKASVITLGDMSPSSLQQLKSSCEDCKFYFLSGDQDGMAPKPEGFKRISEKKVCPDPFVKELNDDVVMISFNSNWFLSEAYKLEAKNSNCETFNELDFFERLDSELEDYSDYTVLLLSHHPTQSITSIGGRGLMAYEFIPVFGNFYNSFKRHIGNAQDLSSLSYKSYSKKLSGLLNQYPNVVHLTGHDFTNAIYQNAGANSININSGENFNSSRKNNWTLFSSKQPSYLKIVHRNQRTQFDLIHSKGRYTLEKEKYTVGKTESGVRNTFEDIPVEASQKYSQSGLTKAFMGSGYRKEWAEKITAPKIQLNTIHGGLKPYARGGGLQTNSLKFKNKEKRKFAFRLLDKTPEKSLGELTRNSVYKNIVQELITTMNPYAPLVVSELIKKTDILAIPPVLYRMPENTVLNDEYGDIIGALGYLEEKPIGKKGDYPGFRNADKIVTTYEMLRSFHKSHKHKMDKQSYARARVFDMFIGDWDRHQDNWKWAQFNVGKQRIYKPIPKDRDHSFSKWTGFIPSIADWVIPNAENFGYKFNNTRQLNFKGRFLDRQLGNELTLKDWLDAGSYIDESISEEQIDKAILAMPENVQDYSGDEIAAKLKSRKKDFDRGLRKYYKEIAKEVAVVGTNKHDYFFIQRNEDGSTEITVYDSNKNFEKQDIIFNRTYYSQETKYINCYGLNAGDFFEIIGESSQAPHIRIVGGSGKDLIKDSSKVKTGGKSVSVYDSDKEDEVETNGEVKVKRPSRSARYEPFAFNYDVLLPLPSVRQSSGNGFGVELGISFLKQGFNKPVFGQKYDIKLVYYPGISAYRIDAGYDYKHLIGQLDFYAETRFSTKYDKMPFLYGIGGESVFDRELREDGEYRIDYDYFNFETGLKKNFWQKSTWTFGGFVEYDKIENGRDNTVVLEGFSIDDEGTFFGFRNSIELDFTDSPNYPTDGNRFSLELIGRSDDAGKTSGNINTTISYFKTLNLGIPTTFIGRGGYQAALGDSRYYHLSKLGSNTNMRGYTRNRFLDKYAMLYNAEVRFNLGVIQTPLIQMHVGVFGLYDGGKLWNKSIGFGDAKWKNAYGGGFFIAPGKTDYALTFTLIANEDDYLYSQLQLGFEF